MTANTVDTTEIYLALRNEEITYIEFKANE